MTIATKRVLNITAIISFVLLAVVALVAHQSPATGYELSIYLHMPGFAWAFLVVSILGGLFIIVHQVATDGHSYSRFWLIGLFILVLSIVTYTWIPYIRGYTIWQGDNITHIGFIKDIMLNGHFAERNFYPIAHIFVSSIVYITGISNLVIANISSALFTIIYALSIYLTATVILPQKGHHLLAVALVVTMPLGVYYLRLTANGWGLCYLPLLFFLLFKSSFFVRSLPYRLLFLLVLFVQPYFHPLSALMVILALVVIGLVEVAFGFIAKSKNTIIPTISRDSWLIPALIESIIFIFWVLSFSALRRNLKVVYEQISTGLVPSAMGLMAEKLGKLNVQGFDFLRLLIRLDGTEIFLIILSLIGIFFLIKQIRSNGFHRETRTLFVISAVYLSFGFFYLLNLLSVPGMDPLGGIRGLSYAIVFAPLLAGYALYELLKIARFRYLAGVVIILVVLLVTSIRIFSMYASPSIYRGNTAVTQMDMTGMAWFFEEKDRSIKCVDIFTPVGRFATAILGSSDARKRPDLDYGRKGGVTSIPDHFGYTDHSSFGEIYSEDKYFPIREYDRLIYNTLWVDLGRFLDEDFAKLEGDSAVDKLYTNGEIDFYYIHSSKSR